MQVKHVPAELTGSFPKTAAAVSHIGSENKLTLRLNKEFRKKAWDSDLARELVNDSIEWELKPKPNRLNTKLQLGRD